MYGYSSTSTNKRIIDWSLKLWYPCNEMKACKVCHIVKENSEFYLCAGRKGGKPRKPYYDKRCKKCSVKRLAKWRLENYGKYIAKKRKWDRTPQGKLCAWKYHLRITYGITTEQYSEKVISQSGRCMICNGNPSKNGLRVDHDHGTRPRHREGKGFTLRLLQSSSWICRETQIVVKSVRGIS